MTSNTTPSGKCSASSEESSTYAAWKAFDEYDNTFWSEGEGGSVGTSAWLQYKFTSNTRVNALDIKMPFTRASSITLLASNDDFVTPVTIGTLTVPSTDNVLTRFVVDNEDSYKAYRLVFVKATSGVYTLNVAICQFYGR
jgi:propanediol dehydratase large subunit